LSLVDVGINFVAVSWTEVEGVSNYKLYRRTVDTPLVVIYSGPATDFRDTNLPSNTTFFYSVSSVI
jgi:hypothetical protein